jgi:lipopolysaccharide assembly protein A
MRWVHVAIVALFAAATLVFLVQNPEIVSVDVLGFSMRAPLALVALGFYVLGAISGGSVFSLLRRSMHEARATAR